MFARTAEDPALNAGGPPHFLSRYFYQRSLQTRVLLTQLPLTVSVLVVFAIACLFHPADLQDPLFQLGMWLHGFLVLVCLLVPWERVAYPSFLAIPYLDFIVVGLLREGSLTWLSGVGLLAVFPVVWLAASGLARRTAAFAALACPLAMVWIPVLAVPGPASAADLARPLLLPLVLFAVAVTVGVLVSSMEAQRRSLEAKDQELVAALESSRTRERLLDAIVETVSVGLVAVDKAGHDVLMNRKQRLFHQLAAPPGNADPNESELLIFAADRSTLLAVADRPVRRAIRGEAFSENLIWLGNGAQARALSSTARPVRDSAGEFDGSVIAFYDVTELVTALAAKDDFVSNISHEFRTPLTSILGYIGLALENPEALPPEVAKYLRVAERNADRLLSLVSDLLSIASPAMDIRPRMTDLAELIEMSMDSAAPAAAENGVRMVNECSGPLMAQIDISRIGQVLDNLLSNAVKYSPDGGTVTVRAWAADETIVCEVRDTGIGMDEAEQAEIFTKFFRSGTVRRSAIPGVGLGLVITKSIIESHGGSISLQSRPGVGTKVCFALPTGLADGVGITDGLAQESVAATVS